MPNIRQLPSTLVNKIAAGEVIERPSSVVKELMENSVDAGATRVEVTIEGGGGELIRVSDTGCGIESHQLPLAVASHATSKLSDDDALFSVRTLGFRGEALASIAGVSHFLLRSRTRESDAAAEIEVRGGDLTGPTPCAAPVGTIIEVRNLFFNTPVRRKFLRSPSTEMGHISEAFTRIALAFPQVHFRLVSGTRELYDLPATDHWQERIGAFFGEEISQALIPITGDDGQVRLHGFVCEPSVNRSNNRMQYLFLNGRHIRDRALQHALGEAYRGLLMVGRFPICFLHLEMAPDLVDVNVHPTKLEVRFADSGRIYGKLLQTLRHTFLTSDLTARVRTQPEAMPAGLGAGEGTSATGFGFNNAAQQSEFAWRPTPSLSNVDLTNIGKGVPAFRPYPETNRPAFSAPATASQSGTSTLPPRAEPDIIAPWDRVDSPHPTPSENLSTVPLTDTEHRSPNLGAPAPHPQTPVVASGVGLQVHNRYLITQDEKGMVVIDQHALHERILYERIREKVLGGKLETQRLLVPEPVTLTPAEAAAALDSSELLAKVGIEVEPFGGDAVLVRGYPAMLANMSPSEMLRQALESLIAAGKDPEIRDLLDHLLHSIACKAAIKAGDRLNHEEITALLEQRHLFQDTHHCPHGRPTALYFSRDELDRMFGRLGPRKIS
jgi:DNA mismatch repair protein MutL